MTAVKDGAVHIPSGMMGFLLNLEPQSPKRTSMTTDITSKTETKGVSHPLAGAWLQKVSFEISC